MISITIPAFSATQKPIYAEFEGYLVGPFDSTGAPYPSQTISYRPDGEYIEGHPSMFGENNVTHQKYEGDFSFFSPMADTKYPPKDASMDSMPRAIKWSCHQTNRGSGVSYLFSQGIPNQVEFIPTFVVPIDDPSLTSFCTIQLGGIRDSKRQLWTQVSITRKTFSDLQSRDGKSFTSLITIESFKLPRLPDGYPDVPYDAGQSLTEIRKVWNRYASSGISVSQQRKLVNTFTHNSWTPPVVSVRSLRAQIDTLIRRVRYAHLDMDYLDYGLLAERACQKVDANQVNMVAFLRDLKNPVSMIPKLKNLLSLKGNADNYLSVNYGLLPTVSDLQSIVKAFQRSLPYIDRNGFKTYNALHTDVKSRSGISQRIEQRIKLAIDSVDSGFSGLLNSLDNAGFLLTFENIYDLIPYSFVIDWFVNVGDFLERVDTRLQLLRLPIRYTTSSSKSIRSANTDILDHSTLTGMLSQVQYSRRTSNQCPVPPLPSIGLDISAQEHVLEGSALIIQRWKK